MIDFINCQLLFILYFKISTFLSFLDAIVPPHLPLLIRCRITLFHFTGAIAGDLFVLTNKMIAMPVVATIL